jgi:SAM-dependent methyltransferase
VHRIGEVRPGDVVLDLGAGTGQIGRWLGEPPARYVALDLSEGMLGVFRRRPHALSGSRLLLRGDGSGGWPVADASIRVVFSSRAVHRMDPDGVLAEAFRAACPEGLTFLVGRVERDPASVKERMRSELHGRLTERARDGRGGRRRLLEAFVGRGATRLEPETVARWEAPWSPRRSLESWAGKDDLAGVDLDPGARAQILDDLGRWALQSFGDLDGVAVSAESYVLEGVRIPGRSGIGEQT